MVCLYARTLHLLLVVSGKTTIDEYLNDSDSWQTLQGHARQMYNQFASSDHIKELRELRGPEERRRRTAKAATKKNKTSAPEAPTEHVKEGDMVHENRCLFFQDALLTRGFADVVKAGQFSFIVLILKCWTFSY